MMIKPFVRLLAVLVFVAFAGSASAQEFVARQIENLVSTDTMKVEISGLSGALSGNVRIQRVTVSDPQGVFLTAEDLAMDWSPLSLVRSNVAIQSLTAARIELQRLPGGQPAATEESSGGGLPNITADIQRIAISEFVLGEQVAGVAARLSAEARLVLSADPTRLEASATIQRLDREGRIAANVVYAPADNRLEIAVDASEPQGGVVAGLLKLPGAPPVQLTVNGMGPLSAFMANGQLTVDNQSAATLTARVNTVPEGRRIAAALTVAAERFAPEALQPYVRGGANLDAQLLLRPDGVIGIEQGDLSSQAIRLAVTGTLDRIGPQTALDIAVASPDGGAVPLRFGTEGSQTVVDVTTLRGTLAGALNAANVKLSANLPQAGYGAYLARDVVLAAESANFNLSGLAGPLKIDAKAASVTAPEGIQRRFLDGAVAIVADGALSANGLALTTGQVTTGVAKASVTGSAAYSFSTFDLTLSSDFQTLALSAAAVPLAGDRMQVAGHVVRSADGALAADSLQVRGTGLTVDGRASLAGEQVSANVTGAIDAAPREGAAFSGRATFALTASGPTAQPDLDITLDSQGLNINGRELADLKVEARGAFTGATPSGSVNVAGTLDGAPLTGSARLVTQPDGTRLIEDLALRQGPNAVTGALRLLAESGAPVGTLDVNLPDVGPLAALAMQQASGDLSGTIELSVNERDFPVATTDLSSNRLAVAGNTLIDTALDLAVEDYLGKPMPTGTVRAQTIEAGGVTITGLTVDLTRQNEATRLDIRGQANGVPVGLAGRLGIQPGETRIDLDQLSAAIPNAAVSLANPSSVVIANGVTAIAPTSLRVGAGEVRLEGRAGSDLDLRLALSRLPLAVADPFVPNLEASGTAEGSATVTGAVSDPQAQFQIDVQGLETSQTRAAALPAGTAILAGTYAGGTLDLANARIDLGEAAIEASGRVGADALDLQARLDAVPVALANAYVTGLDASGTISGTARATGTPSAPNATFDVTGTGITAREVAAAGVPPIELRAAGAYENRVLTLREARATAGEAVLEASGTVGDTLALDLNLRDVPVALANGFVPNLRASGTLSGTAQASGPVADPTATFDVAGTGITAVEVRAAGVAPIELRLAGRYADGTADLQTASAVAGPASIQARGRVGRVLDADVTLAEVPVALANAFVSGLGAEGTVSGTARASGTLADPNATFALDGSGITAAGIRRSGIAPLTLDLAGSVANGTARFERGRITVGEGSVDLSGSVGRELDLTLALNRLPVGLANGYVPDLSAEGTLSGNARATGSLAAPTADFTLTGEGITVAQVKRSGVAPTTLDVAGRYAEGTLRLQRARADIGDGVLTASGTVGQALDLDVTLEDLPVAIANGFLPNLKAAGTLSGSAEATGSLGDPSATFELQGAGITAPEVRAAGVAPLTLDARGAYAGGTATIERARIAAGRGTLDVSGTVGSALDLRLALDRLPVALANAAVPGLGAQGTLSGSAAATGALADPAATFDIRADDVSTAQTRAARTPTLDAVARGTYANRIAQLEEARVTVGGGTVTVTGRAGTELDLQVAIRNLPASLASAAASGIDPAGTINGSGSATGPATNPNATFDLNATGLSIAQTRQAGVAPLNLRANGRFAERRLQLDANLSGGGGIALAVNGGVSLAGSPPQLDLRASGTAPLALANRILAEGGRSVQGTVRLDVAATGPATAPNVTGTISTTGASFVDTSTNLAINSIATTITLNGRSATISSFSARLAAGGTIAVSGSVGLDAGFPADIRVQIANGRYSDGELVAAQLSADLTLTGPLTGTPLLAGSIDIAEMNVLVPTNLPTSLARIDVTHRNAPRAVLKQQAEIQGKGGGGGGGGGINLDVAFNAPREVFVRGRGLDIELGGSLRITGSSSSPAITGGFDLQRGRLVVLGKRLDFARGRLGFTGDLIPSLDLLATSDAGDVTVQIAVTGPANDPSFTFSSTPALPQDEVLARLIFNQGTANLSPLQIAQLAEAAAQLAGGGSSTGLLENLRAQLGVDDLDIRTTADGQTAVGVGKYLNDRTYIGADSTGRVSINLDLGAGLKARGAVSASGGGEVGLFYENEY